MSQTAFLDANDIEQGLNSLKEAIYRKHRYAQIVLLGISEVGYYLAKRLSQQLQTLYEDPLPVGQLSTALYRPQSKDATPHVQLESSFVPCSLRDKVVILVDAFLQTGESTAAAINALSDYEAAHRIELAVLLSTAQQKYPIKANYTYKQAVQGVDDVLKCALYELDGEEKIYCEA
eukprot:COSAG01_NODE_165_length_23303_cov_269.524953_18_plen_176_part_00